MYRRSPIAKIIRLLEKNAGKKIQIAYVEHEMLKRKIVASPRKRSLRHSRNRKASSLRKHEILETLEELEKINIVQIQKKYVHIAKPFYILGKVSLNPRGMAFVSILGFHKRTREIFIAPSEVNGALTGDTVLIRLLDRYNRRWEGRIVDIEKRSRHLFRLSLLDISTDKKNIAFGKLLDLNPNGLEACLSLRQLSNKDYQELKKGDVCIVNLEDQKAYYRGQYVYKAKFLSLEKAKLKSNIDPDLERIAMKYNLHLSYPKVPSQDLEIKTKMLKKRKDLRKLYTITIDGEFSKDFDDAISFLEVSRKKQGTLYVHIADVAYYVGKDSPLDQEARKRGNSYYLANHVLPMLPPQLSENLCSLVAKQDRLCLTVEMQINLETFKIEKTQCYRSVICVNRRFTYQEAEEKIKKNFSRKDLEDMNIEDPYFEDVFLQSLYSMAKAQKKLRLAQGRIDLDFIEASVKYNSSSQIQNITHKKRLSSSILIEECMLSANISVAQFLEKKNIKLLHRNHESMDASKLEEVNAFFVANNISYQLKDTSHSSLNQALKAVANHPRAKDLKHIFQIILLRTFSQANYSPTKLGHWGLGFSEYCHFTSPIRRYPDLVVQRALIQYLEKSKKTYSLDELTSIGIEASETERKAIEAERDIHKLKVIHYLINKEIKYASAFINNIRPERIYLELVDFPIEVIVEAKHLSQQDYLEIKTTPYKVFAPKIGHFIYVGEKWELKIEEIDQEQMKILASPVFLDKS